MKRMTYMNWDKSFGLGKDENGKPFSVCGAGLAEHDLEYQGHGVPYACQARRQKLLLDNKNVAFGIVKINNGYENWTGDPFKDFEIDVLRGAKEDVEKVFKDCVQTCDECCGCGDW